MKKHGTRTKQQAPEQRVQASLERSEKSAQELVSLRQAVQEHDQPLEELARAALNPAKTADPRAERIRRLKEQVAEGSYNPDLRRVAQILLYDETESLLGS